MSLAKLEHRLLRDLETGELALPTPPEIALRVQRVSEDPDSSAADIAAVLRSDAALCARLLQIANSPLLRARNPTSDIKAAVRRLGLDYVQFLCAGLAAEQLFQSQRDDLNRLLREVWAHSLRVASLAFALAAENTRIKGEHAFLGGLMHDIGVLPVIRYTEAGAIDAEGPELADLIASTHTQLGELVLMSWDFPSDVVAAAAQHENIDREHSGPADLVDIVLVANIQAHANNGRGPDNVDASSVPALRRLGLAAEIDPVALELASGMARE